MDYIALMEQYEKQILNENGRVEDPIEDVEEVNVQAQSVVNGEEELEAPISVDLQAHNEQAEVAGVESAQIADDNLCCVCNDARKNSIILNCAHYCVCQSCGERLKSSHSRCPVCRSIIFNIITGCPACGKSGRSGNCT